MQFDGKVSVEAPNPVNHKAFHPRYFILNADKSAFELHNQNTVNEIISKVEANAKVVVLRDSVPCMPEIKTATMIEPIFSSKAADVPTYKEDNIVPYNLRSGNINTSPKENKNLKFGALVGKGLEIGSFKKSAPASTYVAPVALKYRQFLFMESLSADVQVQIDDILAAFNILNCELVKKSDAMQPIELRDAAEMQLASSLRSKLMESEVTNFPEVYKKVISNDGNNSVKFQNPEISKEALQFIENSKTELQEAAEIRDAIRQKVIPPYFESNQGRQFSPDMNLLTSKLAQTSLKAESFQSTSSVTLGFDESDSIIQSELQTSSRVRPSHPTPLHAQGHRTPSKFYSASPTPLQATLTDSLESSSAVPADISTSTKNISQPKIFSMPASLLGGRPGEKPNVKVSTVWQTKYNHLYLVYLYSTQPLKTLYAAKYTQLPLQLQALR